MRLALALTLAMSAASTADLYRAVDDLFSSDAAVRAKDAYLPRCISGDTRPEC